METPNWISPFSVFITPYALLETASIFSMGASEYKVNPAVLVRNTGLMLPDEGISDKIKPMSIDEYITYSFIQISVKIPFDAPGN